MQTAKAPLLTNTPQPTPGLDVQKTRLPNIIVVNVNLDVRKAPDEVALEWLVGSPRTCLFNSRYCSIYQHMQHIQLQSFYTSTRNPVILSPLAKKGQPNINSCQTEHKWQPYTRCNRSGTQRVASWGDWWLELASPLESLYVYTLWYLNIATQSMENHHVW